MENSLIIGRDTEQKKLFTSNILKEYIKRDKKVIVYDKYNSYSNLKTYEDLTDIEYMNNVEALNFIIDEMIETKQETIIFINDFENDFKLGMNEELSNKIINLIINQDETNIKFIISVSLIGHDTITFKTRKSIKNRVVFFMNVKADIEMFDTDRETYNKIIDLKHSNEFLTYTI